MPTIKTARNVSVLLCGMFILVSVLGSPAFAALIPDWRSPVVIGGSGGNPSSTICPKGMFLHGFISRVGDDVDFIAALCATPPGLSTGSPKNLSINLAEGEMGGRGGKVNIIHCPMQEPFVRTLWYQAEGARERTMVLNNIRIGCGPLTGVVPRQVQGYNQFSIDGKLYSGNNGLSVGVVSSKNADADCPDGMLPIGLHGRSGAVVDAVAVVCRPVSGGVNSLPDSKITKGAKELGSRAQNDPYEQLLNRFNTQASSASTTRVQSAPTQTAKAQDGGLTAKPLGKTRFPSAPGQCRPGFVLRNAGPKDAVCVSPSARDRVASENKVAAARRDPKGHYGPNSCKSGFVWRGAFDGDVVCVTPRSRDLARSENKMAASTRVP
ncbi:MAG: hypothetical protein GC149_01595 [Gammaproteobacteria bacterium]|nr:hypothetical protein [Gammaproteobacteria bacterium]